MRKWASTLFVVLAALTVIFVRFNLIPIHIAPDEIAFVRLVLHLDKSAYTMYSPLETGHSTLYFYLILLSFKLFGVTLFALRFPAALCGVLAAVVLYFIYQVVWAEQKNKYLPLIATFIFVTSRWYIIFARFSFEATFLLLLELISLLSMFMFAKTHKAKYIVFSSIFAGLAFHSYIPGRIFFLLPLANLLYLIFRPSQKPAQPPGLKSRLGYYISLFLIPFFIIVAPLVNQINKVGDYRVRQESVFADERLNMATKIAYVGQNVVSNVSMLFITGDMNGRHNYPGKPALNPILGLLFLVGLIPFFSRRKKTMYDHIFFIYLIISLIPTLLTSPKENPNMLRTYTMLPSIMYFIGVSLTVIASLPAGRQGATVTWQSHLKLYSVKIKYASMIVMTLLIVSSSLYELRTYFVYQKEVSFYAFEVKKPFEWIKARNFKLVEDWYKP